MIIVEGPDNSGKTTLIEQFAGRYPQLKPVKSPGVAASYDWWMEQLTRDPEELAYSIFDRFYFSELVYGPLCRNKIRLSDQQQEVVESLLLTAMPLIIRCHLIRQESLFNNRPQEFDWGTQIMAEELYTETLNTGWNTLEYRPAEGEGPLGLSAYVSEHLRLQENWLEFRSACRHGRGCPINARFMIMGQSFARDNTWKTPFERSQSGQMLHNALRILEVDHRDVWFTNAYKKGDGMTTANLEALTRELEWIRPHMVVALGSKASGLLSILSIPHEKARHPGFFLRRFGQGETSLNIFTEELRGALDLDNEEEW